MIRTALLPLLLAACGGGIYRSHALPPHDGMQWHSCADGSECPEGYACIRGGGCEWCGDGDTEDSRCTEGGGLDG